MRILLAFLLICLAGCYYDTSHMANLQLYTEAERVEFLGVWPSSVAIYDSKKNLADLHPLPSYLWNDSMSCRLVADNHFFYRLASNGDEFDSRYRPYNPADGAVTKITLFFLPDNPRQWCPHEKEPGKYHISLQFNGSAGIHNVCGTFDYVRSHQMISNRPGDWH